MEKFCKLRKILSICLIISMVFTNQGIITFAEGNTSLDEEIVESTEVQSFEYEKEELIIEGVVDGEIETEIVEEAEIVELTEVVEEMEIIEESETIEEIEIESEKEAETEIETDTDDEIEEETEIEIDIETEAETEVEIENETEAESETEAETEKETETTEELDHLDISISETKEEVILNADSHIHATCGINSCSGNHTSSKTHQTKTYEAVASFQDLVEKLNTNGGGSYYLTNNIRIDMNNTTMTTAINEGVELCLNGKVLTVGDVTAEEILKSTSAYSNPSINITNCKNDEGGYITSDFSSSSNYTTFAKGTRSSLFNVKIKNFTVTSQLLTLSDGENIEFTDINLLKECSVFSAGVVSAYNEVYLDNVLIKNVSTSVSSSRTVSSIFSASSNGSDNRYHYSNFKIENVEGVAITSGDGRIISFTDLEMKNCIGNENFGLFYYQDGFSKVELKDSNIEGCSNIFFLQDDASRMSMPRGGSKLLLEDTTITGSNGDYIFTFDSERFKTTAYTGNVTSTATLKNVTINNHSEELNNVFRYKGRGGGGSSASGGSGNFKVVLEEKVIISSESSDIPIEIKFTDGENRVIICSEENSNFDTTNSKLKIKYLEDQVVYTTWKNNFVSNTSNNPSEVFISDTAGYIATVDGENIKWVQGSAEHKHKICGVGSGTTCNHSFASNHTAVNVFTAVTQDNFESIFIQDYNKKSVSHYLAENITISGKSPMIQYMSGSGLCLNGKTITVTGGSCSFNCQESGFLTDCQGNGKIVVDGSTGSYNLFHDGIQIYGKNGKNIIIENAKTTSGMANIWGSSTNICNVLFLNLNCNGSFTGFANANFENVVVKDSKFSGNVIDNTSDVKYKLKNITIDNVEANALFAAKDVEVYDGFEATNCSLKTLFYLFDGSLKLIGDNISITNNTVTDYVFTINQNTEATFDFGSGSINNNIMTNTKFLNRFNDTTGKLNVVLSGTVKYKDNATKLAFDIKQNEANVIYKVDNTKKLNADSVIEFKNDIDLSNDSVAVVSNVDSSHINNLVDYKNIFVFENDDKNKNYLKDGVIYLGEETTPVVNYNYVLDANGGSINGNNTVTKEITAGEVIDQVAPTRTGYDFDGYWTAQTGGTKLASNATWIYTENKTFYAHWTAKEYKLVLDANQGTVDGADKKEITVYYDSNFNLTDAVRTGYTFDGYYTLATGGTKITAGTWNYTENKTFYAHWKAIKYTVVFNQNGATGTNMQNLTVNYDEEKYITENNNWVKTGYKQIGWSTNQNDTNPTIATNGKIYNLTTTENETIVLYAIWDGVEFTIKFDKNGGQGSDMPDLNVKYGVQKALTENTYTHSNAGKIFVGWNRNKDADVAEYVDKYNRADLISTEEGTVVLYAIWEDKGFDLIFDANGGTVNGKNTETINVNYGKEFKYVVPVRLGYDFTGYWTERENGTKVDEGTWNYNSGKTLYAHWEAINYYVEFYESISSTGQNRQTHTYDAELSLTENSFTKTGYHFKGWSLTEAATSVDYADRARVINLTNEKNKIIKLYAVWEKINFKVLFNNSNGSGNMNPQNFTYDEEQHLSKNTFSKLGYKFIGWDTNSSAQTVAYEDMKAVKNLTSANNGEVTLYAVWEAIKYNITFDVNTSANTGSGTMNSILNVSYDSSVVIPAANFTKNKLVFSHWELQNPEKDSSGKVYARIKDSNGNFVESTKFYDLSEVKNLSVVENKNVVLKAIWDESFYYIKFEPNAPTSPKANVTNNVTGSKDRQKAYTYSDTTLDNRNLYQLKGYTLDGWSFTQSNGTEIKFALNDVVNKLTEEQGGEVVLKAVWKNNQVRLKYKYPEYTTSYANEFYDAEYDKRLPTVPSVNGIVNNMYEVVGWSLTENTNIYNTRAEAENHIIKSSNLSSNIIRDEEFLYPVIYKIGISIIYKNDDGTALDMNENKHLPQALNKNNSLTIDLPNRKKYNFIGWTGNINSIPNDDSLTYHNDVISIPANSFTGDEIRLTAHWELGSYKIIYDADDQGKTQEGNTRYEQVVNFDEEFKIESKFTSNKKNYTISAFYTQRSGNGTRYDLGINYKNITENSEIVLYAYFTKVKTGGGGNGGGGGGGGGGGSALQNQQQNLQNAAVTEATNYDNTDLLVNSYLTELGLNPLFLDQNTLNIYKAYSEQIIADRYYNKVGEMITLYNQGLLIADNTPSSTEVLNNQNSTWILNPLTQQYNLYSNANGLPLQNVWQQWTDSTGKTNWYKFDAFGNMQTGFILSGQHIFYLNEASGDNYGKMIRNASLTIGNLVIKFNEEGALISMDKK